MLIISTVPAQNFFKSKIEIAEHTINRKTQNLRRLEAQRNNLNARVRLLREELQLLQEPGSYVGEVVKLMGKTKVLVKTGQEGKYIVDFANDIKLEDLRPNLRVALRSDCESRLASSVVPQYQYLIASISLCSLSTTPHSTHKDRPSGISDDGGKGARQYLRDGRWIGQADQGDQGGHRAA